MNAEDLIKLRIEKLKDEKENLKFGYSLFLTSFIALLIFIGTIAITVAIEVNGMLKIFSMIGFIMLFFAIYLLFKYTAFKPRSDRLNAIAKEITSLYSQLLK